jgi:hypothetical protein
MHLERADMFYGKCCEKQHRSLEDDSCSADTCCLPAGMTLAELTEKARQRANTAGAPDVLNFLRNHVAKVRHLSSTCVKQRASIIPA